MALLSPTQIHEVLRPSESQVDQKLPKDLKHLLNKSGLSKEDIAENISSLMRCGETDNVKLQAAKLGAQMQEMLESEETGRTMNVQIIINDSQYATVNPILIPRL